MMKEAEQLIRWVDGESRHDDLGDRCCPDFSCCQPRLQAPRDVREQFMLAWEQNDNGTVMDMLAMFFCRAFGDHEIRFVRASDAGIYGTGAYITFKVGDGSAPAENLMN